MVSQTARYALIILGYLAERAETWCPVGEIASATCIPPNYLSKILNRLAKEGLVASLKGWGGGFRLHPAATSRPIRDVIRIMEGGGSDAIQECMFGLPRCDESTPCPLHEPWREIRESYERMTSGISIGDLSAGGTVTKRRRCADQSARPARRTTAPRAAKPTAGPVKKTSRKIPAKRRATRTAAASRRKPAGS